MPTRTAQAKIRRYAVFVKEIRSNRTTAGQKSEVFVRRPYNIVEYDWNDGNPKQTYLEPTGGRPIARSESEEVYDELKVFDTPPSWDKVGRG